ncbi:SHOCT domain-containing protein [Shewanella sp. HL-SH2]|uniref:SHOCT domain-containing protein n=1 Tax=Shewanella sp. HL-SH2 TaxID=3436238 RepID=UPI003EBEAB7B
MGGMWFWWIAGIVIIAALIWAMLRISSQKSGNGGVSAEELLKQRYANGEIDKDVYEKRLHDIRQ